MRTKAVRMYGKKDLRMEEFELPEIQDDEILAMVVSDSVCMSTYKAAVLGPEHKRVPEDIAENPVIVGHEFSGLVVKAGSIWEGAYPPGLKFSVQPNINHKGIGYAPGYSFPYFGGAATYIVIPNEVMEKGFLLPYTGDAFFKASLSEPMSCIVAGFHATYHSQPDTYELAMGSVIEGNMALLAGVGPMGLGAIDYAVHCDRPPRLLVVTDIDQKRLDRAKKILPASEAEKFGVDLRYVNTSDHTDPEAYIMELSGDSGYDDVFVFAPVRSVVEMGDHILAKNGCLNFFAGPTDKGFSAEFNFYDVHYAGTHIAGTSGGFTSDMKESLDMMGTGKLDPSVMITHIGGLNSAAETTLSLPQIPGGKKLIYTHIDMELTALADFAKKGETDPLYARLAELVHENNGLWSAAAERFLLSWFGV